MEQLKKGSLFVLLLTVLLAVFFILAAMEPFRTAAAYLTGTEDYLISDSNDIVSTIQKMQQPSEATRLILGDSVCYQLMNPLEADNPDYCIAGTNRAVTIAGQYLLAREFLNAHPDATDVYLYLIPDSLAADYDTVNGYVYAAAPFVLTGLTENLQPETAAYMEQVYTLPACRFPGAWLLNRSTVLRRFYLNAINEYRPIETQDNLLNERSVTYLRLLAELCSEKQVQLYLLPGPVEDNWHNHDNRMRLREQWEESGLQELFPDYFAGVHFYDGALFEDGVHFKDAEMVRPEILHRLAEDYGVWQDLIY